MKLGLVLEGGGMRGLYTAGVLDVFMDKDLHADVICGTSAGVTFGINLPSLQRGRVLRYNINLGHDKRYISLRSFLLSGNMVNKEFAYDLLPNVLDPFDYDTYNKSGVEFYATVTNVNTGLPEYIQLTDCLGQMDVIRASASLPFLSRKVYLDGIPYLDGGISDNIPLDKCLETGCDKIVVILTHPKGYVKKESLYMLSRFLYPRDKALQEAFRVRNKNYNQRLSTIEQLEAQGKIIVLRPSREVQIGRLERNPERLTAMYDLGVSDAQAFFAENTLLIWQTIT